MTETQSNRFKDAIWFPKETTYCIVGGAGGIGSWLTLLLARACFTPVVFDFDTLEEHNMAGQLYPRQSIELSKVDALSSLITDFADTQIITYNEAFTSESMSSPFMFSAFDNMKARKDMFEVWVEGNKDWKSAEEPVEPIFIDGRLSLEQIQIFCVTMDKIDQYREHLFDDSEVEDAPCTLKQTSHTAAMIGAHMVGFFTNHIANLSIGDKDRNIPFMWEYFIPVDYLNIT